jgi:DNA-binding MarR family transcriptional regulator
VQHTDFLSNTENTSGYLLWYTSKLWQKQVDIALADLNLTNTQAVILLAVVKFYDDKNKATQRVISEATKIDGVTASQAIRTLEKKWYLKRDVGRDRRSYTLTPTVLGIKSAEKAAQAIKLAHTQFFEPINTEAFNTMSGELIKHALQHTKKG